jgi:hypothetical protein
LAHARKPWTLSASVTEIGGEFLIANKIWSVVKPNPKVALKVKCYLAYYVQCVVFFISNDGYTGIAVLDELFKSFGIAH